MNEFVGMSFIDTVVEGLFPGLRPQARDGLAGKFAALREHERLESVLLSRKAELVASIAEDVERRQLVHERTGGKGIFSFSTREAALLELAPALGVTTRGANLALTFAEAVTKEYPLFGAKLAAGQVTAKTARSVADQLPHAPKWFREQVDAWLAEQAPRWRMHSHSKIQTLLEAKFISLDPEWVKEKHEKAHQARGIHFQPSSDNMAKIWGTMPLLDAAEIKDKLDALAKTACPGDPRAPWSRRADALVALARKEDQLHCECGKDTCKATQRPAPQTKPVELIVDLGLLANLSDLPAWLNGAPIDPELARELAKTATRIKFTALPEHYVPTSGVETHVRRRDKHCRWPGCHRRARTELDHSIPFDHENPCSGGQTVPENLKRLCRYHHRAKTHGRWRDKQSPDGTVTWTSPTGQTYTTTP